MSGERGGSERKRAFERSEKGLFLFEFIISVTISGEAWNSLPLQSLVAVRFVAVFRVLISWEKPYFLHKKRLCF